MTFFYRIKPLFPVRRGRSKLVKAMKLTSILILATCLHVSARGIAQTFTIRLTGKSMEQAFRDVTRATGYRFYCKKSILSDAKPVTLSIQDGSIKAILDQLFEDQPLAYELDSNAVLVNRKQVTVVPAMAEVAPIDEISGVILNEKGSPMAGVSVSIKGTNLGTQTDEKGQFMLKDIPIGAVLVISHIGYQIEEIKLEGRQEFRIRLKEAVQTLADMNVVVSNGYQNLPKERATGSYDFIDNKLLNRSVSSDILSRLNGVASGVLFDNTANNGFNMQIRGMSTIQSSTQPLIILNDLPYDGDINSINPNDIESITILKDAAAASIWGARAGNGVVVITAKKGRYNQPLNIGFNANFTASEKPNLFYNPNFLDANDFINVETQLFNNGFYDAQLSDNVYGITTPVEQILAEQRSGTITADQANAMIASYRKLDVRNDLKKYFYRGAANQQYSLNLAGGSNKANFIFSAGFDKDLATQVGNKNQRITLNSLNTFNPIDGLEITAGLTYVKGTTNADNTLSQLATGSYYGPTSLYPYEYLADAKGNALPIQNTFTTNFVTQVAPTLGFLNWQYYPLQELRDHYNTTNTGSDDIRALAGLKYTIFPGLNIEGKYLYEKTSLAQNSDNTAQSYATRSMVNLFSIQDNNGNVTGYNVPPGDVVYYIFSNQEVKNSRAQLTYNKIINDNSVSLLGGYELNTLDLKGNTYKVYGFDPTTGTAQTVNNVNSFFNNYGGGSIPSGIAYNETINYFRSYFANGGYTYKSKYTFSASERVDQSNLFGVKTNQKQVPLWSTGLKWDIDKEPFFNISWFNTLKAKATYGGSGNVNNSIYATPTASFFNNGSIYGSYPSAMLISPGDPDLTWEKSRMLNLGLDFGFFRNNLSGSLDYYRRQSMDLIGNTPLPASTGIYNFTGNNADMKGNGIDLKLDATILKGKLKWNTELLASYTANKITKYLGTASGTDYNVVVGRPVSGVYGLKWAGLDPTNGDPRGYLNDTISKDYASILNQPLTGTQNKFSTSSSWVYKGPAQPTYFGGVRNTFSYKNISLSANIIFKAGYVFQRSSIDYYSLFNQWQGNMDYTKRWQHPGDEKKTNIPSMPNLNSIDQNRDAFFGRSEVLIDKGDQIRFQDINLSYDFPKSELRKSPFSNLQVYLYANNLGLIWRANKDHLDPDVPAGIPNPKTISFGIKTNL
jgi:TonB-linked SusC/RagA family outer membrane protein